MVVAYLRGLLKPEHGYGLRSRLAENVIFEALIAEDAADSLQRDMQVEAAMLPILNQQGLRDTMDACRKKDTRISELRLYNIHRLDEIRTTEEPGRISLYKLYKIAEKNGILAALQKHLNPEHR